MAEPVTTDEGAAPHDATHDAGRQVRSAAVNMLTLLAQASMPAFHVQLARLLGRGDYGLYVWSNTVVDLSSSITLFGMDVAVSRQVALAGEPERVARAVGTGLRVVLLSGLLVAAAVWLGADTIARRAGLDGVQGPLRALTAVPIAYHAATMFLVATQSRWRMRYDFWTRGVFQPLALLSATTLLLRLGGGVTGAALAVAGAMTLTALVAAWGYSRELPLGATLRAIVSGPWDREVLRTGLPMLLIGVVWSLQGRLDNTVLGAVRGAEATGAYGACTLYAITIGQMRGVFVPGLNAQLPPLIERDDRAAINAVIRRTQRWVAMLSLPLLVLFSVFGRDLLTVFGRTFPDAAPALALLSVAQLFAALSIPAQVLVLGPRRAPSVWAAVASLAVQAVLLQPLCARFGLVGAAGSAALGMLVAQSIQQVWSWRYYRVHGFSWGLLRVFVAAAVAAVAGRMVLDHAALSPLPRFVVGVALAAVTYLVALAALGLGDEERAWLAAIRRRLAGSGANV